MQGLPRVPDRARQLAPDPRHRLVRLPLRRRRARDRRAADRGDPRGARAPGSSCASSRGPPPTRKPPLRFTGSFATDDDGTDRHQAPRHDAARQPRALPRDRRRASRSRRPSTGSSRRRSRGRSTPRPPAGCARRSTSSPASACATTRPRSRPARASARSTTWSIPSSCRRSPAASCARRSASSRTRSGGSRGFLPQGRCSVHARRRRVAVRHEVHRQLRAPPHAVGLLRPEEVGDHAVARRVGRHHDHVAARVARPAAQIRAAALRVPTTSPSASRPALAQRLDRLRDEVALLLPLALGRQQARAREPERGAVDAGDAEDVDRRAPRAGEPRHELDRLGRDRPTLGGEQDALDLELRGVGRLRRAGAAHRRHGRARRRPGALPIRRRRRPAVGSSSARRRRSSRRRACATSTAAGRRRARRSR